MPTDWHLLIMVRFVKIRRTDFSEEEAIYSIVVASKRVLKEITLRSDCTFNNFIISPGEHPPKDSHQQWFSGLRGGWEASSRRPGRDGPSDSKGGRLRCDSRGDVCLPDPSQSLFDLFVWSQRIFNTSKFQAIWCLLIFGDSTHQSVEIHDSSDKVAWRFKQPPIFLVFFTNAGVRWYNQYSVRKDTTF